jgi:exonuclease SbcD
VRLLHTSDWHLGTQIEKASCEQEQREFLDWLVGEMDERKTQLLVVSGDVFHYASPSNAAERMYYDFLRTCAGLEHLRRVVIVAGNHDSPSGLEAPRNVLRALDVTVVGDLPRDADERFERCLHPVENGDGEVEAVVAAVPYVRNSRLGLTVRGVSPTESHAQYVSSFRRLYSDLAERARETYPDVPLIATGHVTAYASTREFDEDDFETDIHACSSSMEIDSEGTVDALPPDVFEDYDYTALGHIHRRMQVGESHVHYSGSPVPTKVDEAEVSRRVLDVRWNGRDSVPETIDSVEVPTWRDIRKLTGSPEEVYDEAESLEYEGELSPYLYLEVELGEDDTPQEPLDRVRDIFGERFDDGDTPRVVDYSFTDPHDELEPRRDDDTPGLQELEPRDVFERKYAREYGAEAEPDDELLDAFGTLVREIQDDQREET